jgi:hypothetical protein
MGRSPSQDPVSPTGVGRAPNYVQQVSTPLTPHGSAVQTACAKD